MTAPDDKAERSSHSNDSSKAFGPAREQGQMFYDLLQDLCNEHERQIEDLNAEIAGLRGERPSHTKDTHHRLDIPLSMQLRSASKDDSVTNGVSREPSEDGRGTNHAMSLPPKIAEDEIFPPTLAARLSIPGAPPADEPPPLDAEIDGPIKIPLPLSDANPAAGESRLCCLLVTVVSARDLRRADWKMGSLSDPYVTLTVEGHNGTDLRLQTRMVAKTLDPVWQHEFVISDFEAKSNLHFNVYDKDWGSDDDSLGNATLTSASFLPDGFDGEVMLVDTGGQASYLKVNIKVASIDAPLATSRLAPLDLWTQATAPPPSTKSQSVHKLTKAKTLKRFVDRRQRARTIWDIFTWYFWQEQLRKLLSPVQTARQLFSRIWAFIVSLKYPFEPMSNLRVTWDLLGMIVLLVELCWIPMQVYDPPDTVFIVFLTWMTLLYWSSDICANLNTAYIHKETGEIVKQRSKIAARYFRSGWLVFDVLLVSVDWATVVQKLVDSGRDLSAGESAAAARAARISRVFRFIRLLRLMRLAKLRQVMYMIQEFVDSESLMVAFTVGRNIFAILLLNHILACLFFAASTSETGWVKVHGVNEEELAMQYVISLQWSLSQFTPGSPLVQAETLAERAFTVTVLALGLIVATVFVSSITSAMGAAWAANRYSMSQNFLLRQYLQQNKISHGLAARVTRYVDCVLELRQKKIPPNRVHYLDLLSGPLNFELKVELNVPHLVGHAFFKKLYYCSPTAMGDICTSALEHVIYTKTDKVFGRRTPARCMSFSANGTLTYRCLNQRMYGRIAKLDAGHWFTEAVLWIPWRHKGQMKALTEVALLNLSACHFIEIMQQDGEALGAAKEESARFARKAQAHSIFKLPMCDIPLDHLTGRPSGVALNYYDISQPRFFDGDVREAEDHESLKVLWQSDSESSASDGGSSVLGDKRLRKMPARSLTRRAGSTSHMDRSRSLGRVLSKTPKSARSGAHTEMDRIPSLTSGRSDEGFWDEQHMTAVGSHGSLS